METFGSSLISLSIIGMEGIHIHIHFASVMAKREMEKEGGYAPCSPPLCPPFSAFLLCFRIGISGRGCYATEERG
jgi:hypothetical protein